MAAHGYNLTIKAANEEMARVAINDWLSIPAEELQGLSDLGYNEVMASIVTDNDLSIALNEWKDEMTYDGVVQVGGLIWWKDD